MRIVRQLLHVGLAIFLLIIWPAVSTAEESEGGTYIRMEETEIVGVIEHPEVTYIIPKTRIRFRHIPLRRTFRDEMSQLKSPDAIEDEIYLRSRFLAGSGR